MSGELAEAVVDLSAIAHNVRAIEREARTGVMAVVKADGFGHGAVPVGRAALAAGATWLGVTSSTEALTLRAAGIRAPVLSWLHRPDEDFTRLIGADVDITASTLTHLHGIAAAAVRLGSPAVVQLKADVGLSRNGANGEDWPELIAWARKYEAEGTIRVRGVWSHLTNAEDPTGPGVARQVATFREALQLARGAGLAPELVHLANSAAALGVPSARYDLCRIGLALYGVDPFGAPGPGRFGLRPAMSLRTTVVNVKRVPAGSGVSYGPEYVTDRATTLALIPLGYADGLSRTTEGRARVWVRGRRCPVVGRIAMDQCVVDVGDLPVQLGDPVVVFGTGDSSTGDSSTGDSSAADSTGTGDGSTGDGSTGTSDSTEPTVNDWARWAGTNPHEVLTGVGARVPRVYIHGKR
ncbi:alanine racemase [Micromonospora sp. NPDC050397]|uniref:alanine racemase n=1 Tax=Micromonospora sp. NPDC050397 TaxID=3364279 RepID=UPI00384D9A22